LASRNSSSQVKFNKSSFRNYPNVYPLKEGETAFLNTSLQISLLGIASYGNSDGDGAFLRNAGLVEPTDAAVNRRGFY